jgi:glycosyltransferase involved in cell wall biosynthesis
MANEPGKVALVHDWLVNYSGAERVVEQILEVFPQADVFAVLDYLPPSMRGFLKNKRVTTTFIQRLPGAARHYRRYLPLMPLAIEQLDLSGYDLVISSSHAVAKGVLTGPNQLHVSYVHSPMRYAWDLQHDYLRESGLTQGPKGWMAKWLLHKMRLWDVQSANGVDSFIANSRFVARRIQKVYRRDARVVYPPVDMASFPMHRKKEDFYVTVSRMVPYKKLPMIVEAFAHLPNERLVVIGDGPDFRKVRQAAPSNVQLLGFQDQCAVREHLQRAKAFVFAAEEDFGISLVEAQACGTPVIAFSQGGAAEILQGLDHPRPTGVFFHVQSAQSLVHAIVEFEKSRVRFDPEDCRRNAERFAADRFRREIGKHVLNAWADFMGGTVERQQGASSAMSTVSGPALPAHLLPPR